MDNERRQALLRLGAMTLAGGALLSTGGEAAAAEQVENLNAWNQLKPDQMYESTQQGILIVTCALYRTGADFRATIRGEVDGQARGVSSAGWSQAFGNAENCFTMFVNKGQKFIVRIIDDFAKNYGRGWAVNIVASGTSKPVAG